MKYIPPLLALAIAGLFFLSLDNKSSSDHQEEIQRRMDNFVEALNKNDIEQFSKFWSEDSYYIDFSTERTLNGKDKILDFYKQYVAGHRDNPETLTLQISNISFPSNNQALVKGLIETYSDHKPVKKAAFSSEFFYENKQWIIKSFTVNEIMPPPSHFEYLKDLDWLVGNWVDNDETVDISYHFEWDEHKNFLTQQFTLTILGHEELSGKQIIGWNPTDKKIVSWLFDSDGGYGQSLWLKDNDTWYISMTFIMPQGGLASAEHILKKIDADKFSFASVNRNVEGKLLPNIGPFQVIRKK